MDQEKLLKECIEWLVECYPEDEDLIWETEPREIFAAVEYAFDGGLDAFIKAGE